METDLKEAGSIVLSMGEELIFLQTKTCTQASMLLESQKDRESTDGRTEVYTLESLKKE
jgi:hypothetical protein